MPIDVIVSVKTTGGDYTSLTAAEAGEQRDLVALDQQSVIELYPMIDTSNITFSGWVTDDTHWVIVRTPASNSHAGIWDEGVWYQTTAADMMILIVRNIKIIGLQFKFQGIYTGLKKILATLGSISGTKHYILKCIFRGVSMTSNETYVVIDNQPGNWGMLLYVNNCLFYDFNSGATFCLRTNSSYSAVYANNNNIENGMWGFYRRYGSMVVKNNLTFNMSYGGYVNGMSAGSVNNAYSEGTDPGTNGLDISGYAGINIFEDYVNDNFHLKAGSPCKDMGADLTNDSSMVLKDDIDGASRTGIWDIGMDEITALQVSRLKKPQDRLLRAMVMR